MRLFVGGIRDGDWIPVPNEMDFYRVTERPQPVKLPSPIPAMVTVAPYHTQTYRRTVFCGLKRDFVFYIASGMTPDDAMEKLFRGYHPIEPEEFDG